MDSTTHSTTIDSLLTGNFPVIEKGATILADQVLTRGAVLGKITVGGKLQLLDKDAVDGSEDFYAILAEDTNTTGADKVGPVYLSGQFNSSALSFAAGTVAADVVDAARALNCYIETVVASA